MLSRIGNDVLRAVAVLGGLIVAGALLLSTADPRVAQFRFATTRLGPASPPAAPIAIAVDARSPAKFYATGHRFRDNEPPVSAGSRYVIPGDGDLAIDADGRIFKVQAMPVGIHVSTFRGQEYSSDLITQQIDAPGLSVEPWVVARADGLVVVSAVLGERLRVWTSTDHAGTFTAGGTIPSRVAAAGPVIVGPFGSLFAGVVTPDGLLGVAASADGGRTWSARGVTTVSDVDRVPPAIAVDDAATLYVAFTTTVAGAPRVSIAATRDLGLTWSAPVTAGPPGSHSPQLVAGSLGKVGLAYLADQELVYRHTFEALLPQPFWTEHLVAEQVSCPHPCARAPYEMTLNLRNRPVFAVRAGRTLVVAEQVSGSGVR